MELIIDTSELETEVWDDFVLHHSVNGTLLQTRVFLNYHPEGRFKDASLIIRENKSGEIVALVPACEVYEGEKKIFYSHKGSTFGGIIVGEGYYGSATKIIEIIKCIEEFLVAYGYNKIIYKITPDIFSIQDSALLRYGLYNQNYEDEDELNLYIDYDMYKEDILKNFKKFRQRRIKRYLNNENFSFREIKKKDEIEEFYRILSFTLEKYGTKPVHSFDELIDLKNMRLKENMCFFGEFYKEQMVAGTMVFLNPRAKVAHTQYLASISDFEEYSPMEYLYYLIIKEFGDRGYKKLSWGISTEHGGYFLNEGLTFMKESYGSRHAINYVFYKDLEA